MIGIYEFNWDAGGYGRGIMLVAANSVEEAEEAALGESKYWHYDGCGPRSDIYYKGDKKSLPSIIISSYYQE